MSDANNTLVVDSFNGRTGIVILNKTDIQSALTFPPANDGLVLHKMGTIVGDQMLGNLDMNNNHIINLPTPSSTISAEPARMLDLTNALGTKSQRVWNGSTDVSYNVTISTNTPSGGNDGDVWYRY